MDREAELCVWGGIAPYILKLNNRRKWVASFKFRLLYPWRKKLRCPLIGWISPRINLNAREKNKLYFPSGNRTTILNFLSTGSVTSTQVLKWNHITHFSVLYQACHDIKMTDPVSCFKRVDKFHKSSWMQPERVRSFPLQLESCNIGDMCLFTTGRSTRRQWRINTIQYHLGMHSTGLLYSEGKHLLIVSLPHPTAQS